MVVIKRDGREVGFEKAKIRDAAYRALLEVDRINPIEGKENLSERIASRLGSRYRKRNRAISVEEIQDDVETELMKEGAYEVAKAYIKYRYEHELMRNASTLDGKVLSIADNVNENVIQENSNKNPAILSTQRDYIAGELSRDITNRLLLPEEITKAHEEGIIHFHDSDYYLQRMHNCALVNLEDMLQNGTVISGTLIEKPHSFSTACNIATQIIAQVASKLEYIGGKSDWIDLRAAEDVELKAGEFKLIPLGIAMQLPVGYEAHMIPRSSTYKNFGVIQANHMGMFDESYCGDNDQWYFPAIAMRDTVIHAGERICQFRIVEHQPRLNFVAVESLGNSDRGGIGSTGVK